MLGVNEDLIHGGRDEREEVREAARTVWRMMIMPARTNYQFISEYLPETGSTFSGYSSAGCCVTVSLSQSNLLFLAISTISRK